MFSVSEYIQLCTYVYEMASHRKIYRKYQMNIEAAWRFLSNIFI